MELLVELAGQKVKVALPEAIGEGQPFYLTLAGERVEAVWIRHAGLLVLRGAGGVERHVRLRHAGVTAGDDEADSRVVLEAGFAARMHQVQAVVHPDVPGQAARTRAAGGGGQVVRSQITGRVLKVLVQAGDKVEAGLALLIIEAMKMENRVFAAVAGTVVAVAVRDGDAVQTGKELLRIGP